MDGVDVLDIVFYINKSGYYDDLDEVRLFFFEGWFRSIKKEWFFFYLRLRYDLGKGGYKREVVI